MPPQSPRSLVLNPNVRCERIYPVEGTKKDVSNLKTIGVRLTARQAAHLASVLLAASQQWEKIDLTGYRLEKRKSDGSYHLTVTSYSRHFSS
jgi:hypothetical protein